LANVVAGDIALGGEILSDTMQELQTVSTRWTPSTPPPSRSQVYEASYTEGILVNGDLIPH
jgi:hypothetical protein